MKHEVDNLYRVLYHPPPRSVNEVSIVGRSKIGIFFEGYRPLNRVSQAALLPLADEEATCYHQFRGKIDGSTPMSHVIQAIYENGVL
jgi:hypothetical protein